MTIRLSAAVVIAFMMAASRLLADAVIPPHLHWWSTPFIAFQASLLTSILWLVSPRRLTGARP